MQWKHIDETYLDWVRNEYERRIPYSDYGDDKYKPFFGNLFEIGDLVYVSQISSAKDRHKKMRKSLDFYKLYHPKDNELMAVINLNYMFPVHKSLIENVEYKNIEKYRTFKSNEEKSEYIDLIRIELREVNKLNLPEAARKIYKLKYDAPDAGISLRSFDFKCLETACYTYINDTWANIS